MCSAVLGPHSLALCSSDLGLPRKAILILLTCSGERLQPKPEPPAETLYPFGETQS